ncbi:MAG: restriction endonuclease subunit S [Pseudomonadota bacterium]|nr:restriction endonuclease subunit S [Pseudomonadota bacterium]
MNPSTWAHRTLAELVDVVSGQVDPKKEPYSSMLHVGGENVESGSGRLHGLITATAGGLISGKYPFQPGDVLYSKIRPYLNKVALVDFQGICSADIYPLRAKATEIDPKFLVYLLRSPDFLWYSAQHSARAAIPKINREALLSFATRVPDLVEQRRIMGRIQDAMVRVGEIQQLRGESRVETAALAQAARYEAFCSDAPLVELGSLIAAGPTNGLYKPSTDYGSGTPILRINNFNGGDRFAGGAELKRLRLDPSEARRFALSVGDFVINRVNGSLEVIGKSCTIDRLDEPAVFESNMMKFAVDATKANRSYVLHFLASPQCRDQIKSKAKVIQQASINQQDVRTFTLPLPSLAEQRRIAESLDLFAERAVALRAELVHDDAGIAVLPSSILRKAFAGEL